MNLAATFDNALAAHRAGRLAEAREIYTEILNADGGNFDCLHCLGLVAFQQGDYPEALRRLDQALRANATVALAFNNHGIVLEALKRREEAYASFDRAVALDPLYVEAILNRGRALGSLGRYDEAIADFGKAIALNPNNALAYNDRGKAFGSTQSYEQALRDFDRAIALKPDYREALANRGLVLAALKQDEAAVESLGRALRLGPLDAEAHKVRAMSFGKCARYAEAIAGFDDALALDPNCADTYNNRGIALQNVGQHERALESYDRAIVLNPEHAEAHNNRGVVLLGIRRYADARASFERTIALNPDSAEAHNNRGVVFFEIKQYAETLANADRALAIRPEYAAAHYTRALALEGLSRLEEAIESYDTALALDPSIEMARGKRLFDRMQLCQWDGIEAEFQSLLGEIEAGRRATPPFPVLAMPSSLAHQRKAAELLHDRAAFLQIPVRRPGAPRQGKIRIGYFSADFHNHATAYLAAGLFEAHNRTQFEIIGMCFTRDMTEDMSRRLADAFDRFVDLTAKSDREIALLAREMNIDIAVDLKGHTLDSRPGIFAHRAAPIQVSYLGYPGTMGMAAIDYLIADHVLIPTEYRRYYSEKIAYLPQCYQVNDSKRVISERIFTRNDLGLPASAFVFCCFNNSFKLTPAVFDVWMRLLDKVEGSVLWLLESSPAARENLRGEAQRRGISPDRLIFAKRIALAEHLARHRAADLFLDTFYCNAHTTASDALWAGLPVLTLLCDTFAGRVAASLLTTIGLPDLIAQTPAQYEALALALAADPDRLANLRQRLDENRMTSPLFDTARFTRNIEAAYQRMWHIHESGGSPDHFNVADADAAPRE